MKNRFCSLIASVAVLVALAAHPASAQDRLVLLDGTIVEGAVEAINQEGQVSGKNIPKGITVDGLRRIDTPAEVAPVERAISARLLGGGELPLTKFTIDEVQKCHLHNAAVGEIVLPIDAMRAVRFRDGEAEASFAEAMKERHDEDRVFVKLGGGLEPISGLVEAVDDFNVTLDTGDALQPIARGKVYGIVFALIGRPPSHSGEALVTLTDGSSLWGKLLSLSDGMLSLRTVGDVEVTLPWAKVVGLKVRSTRMVFLSDLEPVDARHQPLVTLERPWQADRSVSGRPLTLGGQVYEKGIGVASRSILVFENEGDFDEFAATIGIDDETQRRGDCVFVVEVDGREEFRQRVTGRDPPRKIAVDIEDSQRIALIVEVGEDLDLSDHADWCDARFLKD